jgi:hypothetical protein
VYVGDADNGSPDGVDHGWAEIGCWVPSGWGLSLNFSPGEAAGAFAEGTPKPPVSALSQLGLFAGSGCFDQTACSKGCLSRMTSD